MAWLYHVLPGLEPGPPRPILRAGAPFIHLCRFDQLEDVQRRHFGGRAVIALMIDANALDPASLRDEDSYGHGRYPHYYADIPAPAILGRLLR
jgi:uncharacterized protein (DUF952 family)